MMRAQRKSSRPEPVEAALARVARGQLGLVARRQALAVGLSDTAIYRRIRSERWSVVFPGVYLVAPVPVTWEHRLVGACLAGGDGAVASHRAAARLWDLPGSPTQRAEISIPRTRTLTLPGVTVHRPRALPPTDRTTRRSIPVTAAARTMIDLASVVGVDRLEAALDDALRRRLTSVPQLQRRVDALGRHGRPGVGVLARLLDERDPRAPNPESPLETVLLRLLRRAGLPPPAVQHEVRHDGRLVARVDLAYPEAMLAIEADGYRHHAGRAAFEHDRARHNALTVLGWTVLHVTWRQVAERPGDVVGAIGRALRVTPRAARKG